METVLFYNITIQPNNEVFESYECLYDLNETLVLTKKDILKLLPNFLSLSLDQNFNF